MKIVEFLIDGAISCDIKGETKEAIIRQLADLLVHSGSIKEKDVARIVRTLLDREALGSTGIGQGVAIPHGKTDSVSQLVGAVGICRAGVDFDSLDGERTHIFFLLLAPEDSAGPHLKALARISRLLKDRHFRDSLLNAKDEKSLLKSLHDEDQRSH